MDSAQMSDRRFSLEDTMLDLPAVTIAQPPDGDDYTWEGARALPDVEPDCTVWTQRVNARLNSHEAALSALAVRVAALEDAITRQADVLQALVLRGELGK